jgi:GNAT superfamily N-acetyltransferase
MYGLHLRNQPKSVRNINLKSERLAYTLQSDASFFARAHAAGIETHLSVAERMAKGGHLAPTRVAQIPGLPERGIMARMRKILTSFGSPWQGLDAEPFVFRTSPDLSSGKADGFVTDVYHKTPKGEDWVGHVAFGPVAGDTGTASVRASMLAQDFRGKGLGQTLYLETMEAASNEGFTHFMSDATGSVSESAQKMWSRLEPEVGAIRSTLKGKPSWKVDLVKNRSVMRAARTKAGAGRVAEAIPRLMKGL